MWQSFFRSLHRLGDCRRCVAGLRVRDRRRGFCLGHLGIAHRGTVEGEAVGIVHEAIENGVGEGRLAGPSVGVAGRRRSRSVFRIEVTEA